MTWTATTTHCRWALRKRPSGDGLYVLSNFTWAKSLDYGTFGLQDPFNRASNYGNSDFVRPLVWITAVTYNLPFGRGKKFANSGGSVSDAVIGGWSLSGIINLESGMYFTPMLANTASLNSTVALRPDQIGNPYVSTPTRYEWFNPAAYAVPALYTYGNAASQYPDGTGLRLNRSIVEQGLCDLRENATQSTVGCIQCFQPNQSGESRCQCGRCDRGSDHVHRGLQAPHADRGSLNVLTCFSPGLVWFKAGQAIFCVYDY